MPGWIDMHVHRRKPITEYIDEFTQNDADIAFNSIGFANSTLMAASPLRDLGGSG
jgi:hypothetical protein